MLGSSPKAPVVSSASSAASASESSHASATFFFVLALALVEDAVVTEDLPESTVAVEVVVLSVSVVESPPNLSSSRLFVSSPSPITSRRLRSDSGSLRKLARDAQIVANTREKSKGYCQRRGRQSKEASCKEGSYRLTETIHQTS